VSARFPLSSKILLLAFVNVALLAGVFAALARLQLRLDAESILMGPARNRIQSEAHLFEFDWQESDEAARRNLPEKYAAANGIKFALFGRDGAELAGPAISLPDEVQRRLDRRALPFERRPPPEGARPVGPPPGAPPMGAPAMLLVTTSHPTTYWVVVQMRIGNLILWSPTFWTNPFFLDYRPWLFAGSAVLVVCALCWLPLIRGLTRSVAQVTRATEEIAQGRFEVHVDTHRRDELGRLGVAINSMAERLSGFVKGQRRLMGDIAHELCSPIARIQFALGILERHVDESQQSAVADLHEEIEHMSALVGELLSFSKASLEPAVRPLGPVNVAETARRAIERENRSGMQVRMAIDSGLEVMADADYLFRSLANLIRNALRYAGDAGPISVSAVRDRDAVAITVADCGPGLPPEALEAIFTPFYRPDAARTRESGGAGLGLAIVKSCVEACQGEVRCRNRAPSGLEVEIRLRLVAAG
jgi:two-component system sensor histidine kinase CpxA